MALALHRRRPADRGTATVVSVALALAVGGSVALGSATALAAGANMTRHSQAAATSQVCDSQFHVAPTSIPSGFESSVLGMAAVSPTDVWAVGITGPSHYNHETLAAHWDGSSWTMVASPHPNAAGVSANLRAVTVVPGIAANNIWAVGDYGSIYGSVLMAAQWNGNGWNLFTPPGTPGGNVLQSVVAISPTDIWAVGSGSIMFGTPASRTLIEHYDGVGWSIVPSADLSPTSSDQLMSV